MSGEGSERFTPELGSGGSPTFLDHDEFWATVHRRGEGVQRRVKEILDRELIEGRGESPTLLDDDEFWATVHRRGEGVQRRVKEILDRELLEGREELPTTMRSARRRTRRVSASVGECGQLERVTGADVVEMLEKQGFIGPTWDRFADVLAAVGLKRLTPWIASNTIFAELARRRISCTRRMNVSEEDALEIAGETVARAIIRFREDVLRNQQWSPEEGTMLLETAFISQCLFQFPNVYRRWAREQEKHFEVIEHERRSGSDVGNEQGPAMTC